MDVEKVLRMQHHPLFNRRRVLVNSCVYPSMLSVSAIYFPYVHNPSRKNPFEYGTSYRGHEQRVVSLENNNRTIDECLCWNNLSNAGTDCAF